MKKFFIGLIFQYRYVIISKKMIRCRRLASLAAEIRVSRPRLVSATCAKNFFWRKNFCGKKVLRRKTFF